MNRILFISDLHLADTRHSPEWNENLLSQIADLVQRRGHRAVLNLGDTVSRKEFLPDGTDPKAIFRMYRSWRDSLGIPFRECTIFRERAFFREMFGQNEDSTWDGLPNARVLTFSPNCEDDHQATNTQWQWIAEQVESAGNRTVIICSHVPYPGACSRPISLGIYLPVPDALQKLLENRKSPVFWASGHFHWKEEPPMVKGALTAFLGGCFFGVSRAEKGTYLRELDLDSLELNTILRL